MVVEGKEVNVSVVRPDKLGSADGVRRRRRRVERDLGPVRLKYDDPDPRAHQAVLRWKSRQCRRTGRPDSITRPWVSDLIGALLVAEGRGARSGRLFAPLGTSSSATAGARR
jgi:CelD/BcsL family acetyltransferase involved in cellulose biosynthesis